MKVKAIFWDVDGTLAETERDGHRIAFNRAFYECGLNWKWGSETYGQLLTITGGKERICEYARQIGETQPQTVRLNEIHKAKNRYYAEIVRSGKISLRPNVHEWINAITSCGVVQGIVTTTSMANLDVLMHSTLGNNWRQYFSVIVCGDDVSKKKTASSGLPSGSKRNRHQHQSRSGNRRFPQWVGCCLECRNKMPG